MRTWLVVAAVACTAGAVQAQDGHRFVERAPLPRFPVTRSYESLTVKPKAVPSVTPADAGGYIGGGRLPGLRGYAPPVYTAVGADAVPAAVGTYGTDYVGAALRPSRVFLIPSADPSVGAPFIRAYRTDGRYPQDVFALRPFRKAVIEKREGAGERKHGGE